MTLLLHDSVPPKASVHPKTNCLDELKRKLATSDEQRVDCFLAWPSLLGVFLLLRFTWTLNLHPRGWVDKWGGLCWGHNWCLRLCFNIWCQIRNAETKLHCDAERTWHGLASCDINPVFRIVKGRVRVGKTMQPFCDCLCQGRVIYPMYVNPLFL